MFTCRHLTWLHIRLHVFCLGDCHGRHGDPEMCVAGGIANFTAQLATYGMKGQSQCNIYLVNQHFSNIPSYNIF